MQSCSLTFQTAKAGQVLKMPEGKSAFGTAELCPFKPIFEMAFSLLYETAFSLRDYWVLPA
jgi:hypothetical protein